MIIFILYKIGEKEKRKAPPPPNPFGDESASGTDVIPAENRNGVNNNGDGFLDMDNEQVLIEK